MHLSIFLFGEKETKRSPALLASLRSQARVIHPFIHLPSKWNDLGKSMRIFYKVPFHFTTLSRNGSRIAKCYGDKAAAVFIMFVILIKLTKVIVHFHIPPKAETNGANLKYLTFKLSNFLKRPFTLQSFREIASGFRNALSSTCGVNQWKSVESAAIETCYLFSATNKQNDGLKIFVNKKPPLKSDGFFLSR